MSAALNFNHITVIHKRLHIASVLRHLCEGLQAVNNRNDIRTILNPFHLSRNSIADFAEHIVFQSGNLILRAENQLLQLL